MTVVQFTPPPRSNETQWRPDELQYLVRLFEVQTRKGSAASWDIGLTDFGDPQFYILGQPPERDCLLCVSRLGSVYVLEDASARLLAEERSLPRLVEQAESMVLGPRGPSWGARVFLSLCGIRLAIEEKLAALLAESEELLLRFAPNLVALA